MKQRILSFKYAFRGIKEVFFTQVNFRIHFVTGIFILIAGFYFGVSVVEWACILLCIGLVLIAEAVNTAIENLVDMVSPGFHHQAGKIKDIAAASVLLAAFTALAVGAVIFYPKIFN